MHSQRIIWLLPIMAFVLVTASFLAPVPCYPSKVTQENFDRVQEGMTEAEVEEILGPPGDYCRNRSYMIAFSGAGMRKRYWWGDEAVIVVVVNPTLDEPGRPLRVREKHFHPVPSETYGGRWLRRLAWKLGKWELGD